MLNKLTMSLPWLMVWILSNDYNFYLGKGFSSNIKLAIQTSEKGLIYSGHNKGNPSIWDDCIQQIRVGFLEMGVKDDLCSLPSKI